MLALLVAMLVAAAVCIVLARTRPAPPAVCAEALRRRHEMLIEQARFEAAVREARLESRRVARTLADLRATDAILSLADIYARGWYPLYSPRPKLARALYVEACASPDPEVAAAARSRLAEPPPPDEDCRGPPLCPASAARSTSTTPT